MRFISGRRAIWATRDYNETRVNTGCFAIPKRYTGWKSVLKKPGKLPEFLQRNRRLADMRKIITPIVEKRREADVNNSMQVVKPAGFVQVAESNEPESKVLIAARRLRDKLGLSLVWELSAAYLCDTPQSVRLLRTLRAAGHPLEFARLAHSLKDSSRLFGLETIEELCAHLEAAGRASALDSVESLLDRLDLELERARAALERCCSTNLQGLEVCEANPAASRAEPADRVENAPARRRMGTCSSPRLPGLSAAKRMLEPLAC